MGAKRNYQIIVGTMDRQVMTREELNQIMVIKIKVLLMLTPSNNSTYNNNSKEGL